MVELTEDNIPGVALLEQLDSCTYLFPRKNLEHRLHHLQERYNC